MELVNLKPYIKSRLESLVNIDVYEENPYGVATFPYLVFKIPSGTPIIDNRIDRILEIDYWSNSFDNSAVLEAAGVVKKGKYVDDELTVIGFDGSFQYETEGFYRSYLDFEGEIPDTEQNIYRINQRYILLVR